MNGTFDFAKPKRRLIISSVIFLVIIACGIAVFASSYSEGGKIALACLAISASVIVLLPGITSLVYIKKSKIEVNDDFIAINGKKYLTKDVESVSAQPGVDGFELTITLFEGNGETKAVTVKYLSNVKEICAYIADRITDREADESEAIKKHSRAVKISEAFMIATFILMLVITVILLVNLTKGGENVNYKKLFILAADDVLAALFMYFASLSAKKAVQLLSGKKIKIRKKNITVKPDGAYIDVYADSENYVRIVEKKNEFGFYADVELISNEGELSSLHTTKIFRTENELFTELGFDENNDIRKITEKIRED